jgi:hypothetical protein
MVSAGAGNTDTAARGAMVLSNSQTPGLYGKIHIYGSNRPSVGVQAVQ